MEKEQIQQLTKKNYYEKYMLIVGTGGQLLFYFQAFKIFANQAAQDVSLLGFTVSFISVASWLIYGVQIKNKVLIIANAFACFGAILVILGILLYG